MKYNYQAVMAAFSIFFCACTQSVPTDNVTKSTETPSISPDYVSVTIPPNIAPMDFSIEQPGSEYVTRVSAPDGSELVVEGKDVKWNIEKWHKMLANNRGKTLTYDVFVKIGDEWIDYSFENKVAADDIDQYISYRLIEPSYVYYGGITINMRDLTSFDESVVLNTSFPCDESRGNCMNCHVPRNQYRDKCSQLHVRQYNGGTIIMMDGKVKKVNLKTDSTLSAGVYPAWHPTLDLIAYSTNSTRQHFPAEGNQRIEVIDGASDLILYDIKKESVMTIANDSTLMETYPAWSPDGKYLYYSVAAYPEGANPDNLQYFYKQVHYDIVRRAFDSKSMTFSAPDTVVYASEHNKSALLPRISPDGKYLLYCQANYGTFHIWHHDSDLYIKNLATGKEYPLTAANSDDTDSYHSWSSNSRWIVFSSRRDDGSYTRPYIAYVSPQGVASKAFVVPQEDLSYYKLLPKSYNVPEFFVSKVNISRNQLVKAIKGDAGRVKYKSK